MKLKKKITLVLLSLSLLGGFASFASEVSAAWYHSTITLPRNGWWSTIGRVATSNTASTKVYNPTYNIASRVKYGGHTTGAKTHYAKQYNIHTHTHGVSGATLNGQFRTSVINQKTNTVYLGWEP